MAYRPVFSFLSVVVLIAVVALYLSGQRSGDSNNQVTDSVASESQDNPLNPTSDHLDAQKNEMQLDQAEDQAYRVEVNTAEDLIPPQNQSESAFGKTYFILPNTFEFSNTGSQTYEIVFDQEIPQVTSITIMGVEGETELIQASFNEGQSLNYEPTTFTGRLYADDWVKSDGSIKGLKKLRISGQALNEGTSSVKIYLQIMGDTK